MNGSYPVMGQFGGGQYCPVSENLGLTPHYSSGWYQSSAADPRFASKFFSLNNLLCSFNVSSRNLDSSFGCFQWERPPIYQYIINNLIVTSVEYFC